jgi:hypothetical protein
MPSDQGVVTAAGSAAAEFAEVFTNAAAGDRSVDGSVEREARAGRGVQVRNLDH